MTWRRAAAALAAVTGLALGAPAAAPAITIDSLTTQPSSTQAGSHPSFTLSMTFGGGSTPKAMRIDLPPGFVGDPNAPGKCPIATFEAGGCGTDSIVGSTVVHTRAGLPGGGDGGGGGGPLPPILPPDNPLCGALPVLCGGPLLPGGLLGLGARSADAGGATTRRAASRATARQALLGAELPLSVPGTVYNLEPRADEPARLGIQILGTIRLQSAIDLRDGSDFGLSSILDDLPNTFSGLPMRIGGMDLTLLGALPSGGSFVTLPTSCTPATTNVSVTPYQGESANASASFTPTGCESVPFTPSLGVTPSTTAIDSNAAYAISLGFPTEQGPIAQSHVSKTTVSLPEGTALNPGAAQGLVACTEAQFAKGKRTAAACPAASEVGTVAFVSPLAGTLSGKVYQGEPTPSQMIRLFVDVPGPGFRIKLVGNVNPDPRTGQVHSEFAGLPPLPFTAFTLTFHGGDKSILVTPPTCGFYRSSAMLTPTSGTAPQTPTSAFTATYDHQGAPCPDPLPFRPTVSASVEPSTAGAYTAMTQSVAREPKTQRLKDMELSFPPGLAGGLGGGIGLCEEAKALKGACPANSRVGSANLLAGPGPKPLNIDGDVFVVAPFKEGTLASLAITVPGKVGPFDLGTTVSFAHISVRKGDSGLEVKANDLPQIVGGIPLGLRQINLKLDRKGFMRNATSCRPQELKATFTSVTGAQHGASTPYQATDCDKVPFAPKLQGVIGKARKGGHPEVTALVTQETGEIASREVQVTLPPELAVDATRIGVACPEGEDCGDRNTVGKATAVTPLLPIPLSGPVKLIAPKRGGLPELRLDLTGLLSISLTGRTLLTDAGVQNTFVGIPDVPLSRFELTLNGGKGGLLATTRALRCGEKLKGTGLFTGHNDGRHRTTGTFEVCGELGSASAKSRTKKAKVSAKAVFKKGVLRVTVKGGKKLKRVALKLPKPATLAGRRGVTVAAGAKARVASVGTRRVTAKKLGTRTVRVTLGKQSLRGGRKADKADKRVTVRVKMGKRTVVKRPKIR